MEALRLLLHLVSYFPKLLEPHLPALMVRRGAWGLGACFVLMLAEEVANVVGLSGGGGGGDAVANVVGWQRGRDNVLQSDQCYHGMIIYAIMVCYHDLINATMV